MSVHTRERVYSSSFCHLATTCDRFFVNKKFCLSYFRFTERFSKIMKDGRFPKITVKKINSFFTYLTFLNTRSIIDECRCTEECQILKQSS